MGGNRESIPLLGNFLGPRGGSRVFEILGHILVFGLALVGSRFVVQRLGLDILLVLLIMAFVGCVYAVLSFRNMAIPFSVWILSIGGFRFLFSLEVPGLPDLFLDRLTLIWLTIIFMMKFFAEGRSLIRPFALDVLVLLHGTYILVGLYLHDMQHFHVWTNSYLIPYTVFFMAKYIVVDVKMIRLVFLLLLVLSIYYNITSIAEKFGISALLWPKYMLYGVKAFPGRSCGPFNQAPLFGTVIGMLLPIHLYFIAESRNSLLRLLLYLSLGLGFAGLYFTYTRGSWLVGIVAIGAAILLNWRRYFRLVAPLLVFVPILAIMVLGVGQDEFMKERVENDNTLDARVGTIATAVRVWKANPIFGVGFFQYRYERDKYIHALEVPILGTIRFVNFRHNSIHDIYFGPLAEDGLVGAGLQFAIYWLILRAFLQKYPRRKKNDHFATLMMPVLAGMFLGYLFGGIAIDYRFFSITGTLFYMSAGILYGYSEKISQNDSAKKLSHSLHSVNLTQGKPDLTP